MFSHTQGRVRADTAVWKLCSMGICVFMVVAAMQFDKVST